MQLYRLMLGPVILGTVLAAHAGLLPVPTASNPLDQDLSASALRRQVEEDFLRQAQAREERALGAVTTRSDALGACDGVKNGKFGFHAGLEPNPWWQVDLGETTAIARIVVFNRLDYAPGLHNADYLRVLTSDDGKSWTLRRENKNHFGGISGAKPLEVLFQENEVHARFVRLQVPSDKPIFFHLDEVEIYGPGAAAKNLALHRPADQSSLSQWSTAKRLPDANPVPKYPTAEFIERGRQLAVELQAAGLDSAAYRGELDALAQRLQALPADASENARRVLYLETRWLVRRLAFANPLLDFDRLLFVKRFTQETYPDVCLNHMPWVSRPGGDICILSAGGQRLFASLAEPASVAQVSKPAVSPVSKPAGARAVRRAGNGRAPADLEVGATQRPGDGDSPAASTLRLRNLLNGALGPGHVHGMDLWWDADRVVFGYARAQRAQPPEGWLDRAQSYRLRRTEEPIHIFEIGIGGRDLRQLTRGEWSDLDPTYAPNGDIVFVSERCATSLQCNEYDKDETSCNLYVMRPDGADLRRLSVSKDGDYLPHTLDDGTIAYTRWEYHERSWAFIQSIWTVRPDGTGADAIFKQHFVNPWALEDTRSIPGSKKLVSIAAGHHTLAIGPLVIVNPAIGINDPKGIGIVTPGVKPPEGGMDGVTVPEGGVVDGGGFYSTPWALSEKFFLAAYTYTNQQIDATGYGLYLVDVFGNKDLVYRDPNISCFIPTPLRPRFRPPVYPEVLEPAKQYAECVVNEASFGCDGVAPEQARYLRISEPIGWPYDNERGGLRYGEDHRFGGPAAARQNLLNWTPVRILGDVPIAPDGSAHFKVPVDTAVYFQLLDADRMELRRMRTFISFQPGEVRACVGCHESRTIAPIAPKDSLAANRALSLPEPPPWGDRPVNFLRDIQPVLDRQCVRCHSGLKPAGGLDFFGGLTSHDQAIAGYGYNRAYETLMEKGLVSISKVRAQDASITPPLAYGSRHSKLVDVLGKAPHTERAPLSPEDRLRLLIWIDANAPYHDRFVDKRPAQPAYDLAADQALRQRLTTRHAQRCGACHQADAVSRLDWIDVRNPAQSLFLLAPLAKAAGGRAKCGQAIYQDQTDPDYRVVREWVEAAVQRAWENPRRDLVAFGRAPAKGERAEAINHQP